MTDVCFRLNHPYQSTDSIGSAARLGQWLSPNDGQRGSLLKNPVVLPSDSRFGFEGGSHYLLRRDDR